MVRRFADGRTLIVARRAGPRLHAVVSKEGRLPICRPMTTVTIHSGWQMSGWLVSRDNPASRGMTLCALPGSPTENALQMTSLALHLRMTAAQGKSRRTMVNFPLCAIRSLSRSRVFDDRKHPKEQDTSCKHADRVVQPQPPDSFGLLIRPQLLLRLFLSRLPIHQLATPASFASSPLLCPRMGRMLSFDTTAQHSHTTHRPALAYPLSGQSSELALWLGCTWDKFPNFLFWNEGKFHADQEACNDDVRIPVFRSTITQTLATASDFYCYISAKNVGVSLHL